MSTFDKVMTEFHAHLDGCMQCEQHPFELCSEGQKIMNSVFHEKTNINAMYGKFGKSAGGRVEPLKEQPTETNVYDVKSKYPKIK